jgi:hypothetical protein
MWWQFPYNPAPGDDDWEGQPRQGAFYKWTLGVVLPIALGGYGLFTIATKQAEFGSDMRLTLHGSNAIAFGIAWVSAALFIHCHYFWGNIYDQIWFAVLGKIVSACGFIAGLVFVLIHNGVLGIG